MTNDGVIPVRVRTAADKGKALAIYNELRRSGRVARALIVAQLHDGSWQVLGSGMVPSEMTEALFVGANALTRAEERMQDVRPEPHEEPVARGEPTGDTPLRRSAATLPDGTLQAPLGEGWMSCGECHHPRWFATHKDLTAAPGRLVCAHCGNEVVFAREDTIP